MVHLVLLKVIGFYFLKSLLGDYALFLLGFLSKSKSKMGLGFFPLAFGTEHGSGFGASDRLRMFA